LLLAKAPPSAQILVRSVRLAPELQRRRSFIESFGLTGKDLEQISALPDVTEVVPVRSFPVESRRLARLNRGYVIGTVPPYLQVTGVRLAAGRFLDDEEDVLMRNVAVLGADAALALFPQEDPIGRVVRLGSATTSFEVVGILQRQGDGAGSLAADQVNKGVFIPLRTCKGRFGQRIILRLSGTFVAQEVALHDILVAVQSRGQVPLIKKSIAALLTDSHPRKDWEVRSVEE
jgi:putative ABC transport system permease protein